MNQSDQSESIFNMLNIFLKLHKSNDFSIMDLIEALGERSFGFILLLMALLNTLLITSIPGLSAIVGSVMVLTSIQMILRLPTIWLPLSIREKTYSKDQFDKVLKKSASFLTCTESFLKPRILILTTRFVEPFLGLISLINSLWITLPIPFGNFLPGAAMVILSLGIIAKDGIFIINGIILSIFVWMALIYMYSSLLFSILAWFYS
jgi:hypothetical protein